MPRVGFLIDRWEPERGGAERALARLAAQLEADGADVRAYATHAADAAPGTLVPVRARGLTRAARERSLGEALVDAAERDGCDVTIGVRHLPRVDVFWPHGGAHSASLAARREARGRALDAAPHGRHRTFLAFERELLDQGGAGRVVCVSELVRSELVERYPSCEERCVVAPLGLDLEARPDADGLATWLELDGGVPTIAFLARDPLLKGVLPLAEALVGLLDRPWRLVVAGPRHVRRWERILERAGLPRERLCVVSDVDGRALIAAADLVAHPTWRDPAGLVVLEALAAGTPVVTTRRAGEAGAVGAAAGSVVDSPADVAGLRAALARWIAPDGRRDFVRADVADRGLAPWLARMSELVYSSVEKSRTPSARNE